MVADQGLHTLTMLAIFVAGVTLHFHGRATIGDIVMFMNFAGLLIGQLETSVRFINKVFTLRWPTPE